MLCAVQLPVFSLKLLPKTVCLKPLCHKPLPDVACPIDTGAVQPPYRVLQPVTGGGLSFGWQGDKMRQTRIFLLQAIHFFHIWS